MKTNLIRKLIKWYFNRKYKRHPPEMVKYWQWADDAKLARVSNTIMGDGSYAMDILGEKYPYPGFPRGHLLSNSLSRLKHVIKNRIFNDSWQKLEDNVPLEDILKDIKEPGLSELVKLTEAAYFDMLPVHRMVPPVREIWRAFTEVEKTLKGQNGYKVKKLKECMCFVLQEDDAYRFRVQWLVNYFNPNSKLYKLLKRNPVKDFETCLEYMEDAEVVDDMKGRIKLLRRVLLTALKDKTINKLFYQLCREMDWNKLKLSKIDKYYFRGKYFKVDHDKFDY